MRIYTFILMVIILMTISNPATGALSAVIEINAIITTIVRDLGLSHSRVWLSPAGVEDTNDNNDPQVTDWDAFNWEGHSMEPTSTDRQT